MRAAEVENQIPPSVMDIINNLRDGSGSLSYRENLAQRLETIAECCEAEVKKFRSAKRRR